MLQLLSLLPPTPSEIGEKTRSGGSFKRFAQSEHQGFGAVGVAHAASARPLLGFNLQAPTRVDFGENLGELPNRSLINEALDLIRSK